MLIQLVDHYISQSSNHLLGVAHLLLVVALQGHHQKLILARIFWNQLNIVGSTMGDMDEFRSVVSLFKSGMKPVIDSIHDASDAQSAFARLESGEQFGKVVIRWQ